MKKLRIRFTSAHAIALVALFVALGGNAFAFHLGKNAVKTKNIKNGAVTERKLAPGAVSEAKLAQGAVTAAKLAPGAVHAPTIVVREAEKPLNDGSNAITAARCQPGELATGGGGLALNQAQDIQLQSLRPMQIDDSSATTGDTPGGFDATFVNPAGGGGNTTALAYVLCMRP